MNNDPVVADLRVFCTLVRRASFVATATELGSSPAYVSKRIGVLEAQLGVRLFNRTTRRVHISEEGELVYQWALKILDDMAQLSEAVASTQAEPSGTLRISTSIRLGREHVAPILSKLGRRHPKLDIWLELLDRRVDLLGEGFDIDLRVGEPTQPHLVAHRIAQSHRVLCASPAYVAQHGQPRSLDELAQHECLPFRDRDDTFGTWRLHGPKGMQAIKVRGRMGTNHRDVAGQWALDGHGIVLLSVWDVAPQLADGSLVRVLPAYSEPADVWAVCSTRTSRSARVAVCIAYLKKQLLRGPHALVTQVPGVQA